MIRPELNYYLDLSSQFELILAILFKNIIYYGKTNV